MSSRPSIHAPHPTTPRIIPNWISAIAQKLLVLSRWTGSLHGSFFPHLALSNEDIVSRFSSVVHWTVSQIKAFAWHPHTLKFSYALKDDTVRVHANFTELASSLKHTELVPILKHKLQKNVACLAWHDVPEANKVYSQFVYISSHGYQPPHYFLQYLHLLQKPNQSLATRPSSSSVQVLQESGHCPITSLSWSPDGRILMSSSPVDTAMMAWDVALETCTPLRRFGGGGVSLVAWSPDGSKLFSATPSNLFRVWETRTWSCEKWSTSTGPCKTACWSPKGNILLFATENQPVIYSLTFSEVSDETKPVIGGSQTAMACADLSETDLQTADSSNVKVGGLIQHMAWDSKGERLAVIFQGNCEYVAVFRTKLFPVLEITSCGFVKGFDSEKAEFIEFQPNYSKGAMLTVIWSSGRVGYVPMYFVSSSSTTTVSSLEEEFKYQQHQHTFSNGLYSTTD
ncbi:aladin-like [Ruditapes philippinarum]|uniref:aladin-like n=1 Tax=Ruditapes philippinarum TaxID=129788 RepID=UPI00295B3AC9|nr:aladin-like [Ruditapes philippinarum]